MYLLHRLDPILGATPPPDGVGDRMLDDGDEVSYIRTSDRTAPGVDVRAIWARTIEFAAAPLGLTVHEHVRRFVNLMRSPRSNVFVAAASALSPAAATISAQTPTATDDGAAAKRRRGDAAASDDNVLPAYAPIGPPTRTIGSAAAV